MPKTSDTSTWQDESDAPWKGFFECFPKQGLHLCYPDVATEFDWSFSPVNLSQEMESFLKKPKN